METIYNKQICTPIESEDAKCHPDLGDGRKSYINNGFQVFQHGEQWYVTLGKRDEKGRLYGDITLTDLKMYFDLFGMANVIEMYELPEIEVLDD